MIIHKIIKIQRYLLLLGSFSLGFFLRSFIFPQLSTPPQAVGINYAPQFKGFQPAFQTLI